MRSRLYQWIVTLPLLLWTSADLIAQTTDFTTNHASASCNNRSVSFSGSASATTTATSFTFNGGSLPVGWSSSPYTVGQPCNAATGNTPDNSNYFWASDVAGARFVQTNAVDVSLGGSLDFLLRFGNDDPQPGCEQADGGEGVNVQYSINNGSSWTTIIYYDPNSYYSWTSLSVPIPSAAYTTTTLFRWIQPTSSGVGFDNWGLEDVSVNAVRPVSVSTWNWTFGDGNTGIGQNVSHTYATTPGSTNYSVTLTATFSTGTSDSETKTYTVYNDNTPPSYSCLTTSYTLNTGSGTCTPALPDLRGDVNSWDDCSSVTETQSIAIGTPMSVGTHSVSFTLTDADGNSSVACPITVNVVDNSPPAVSVQNITRNLDASGNVTIGVADVKVSSSDNCGIASETLSKSTFSCADVGNHSVTLTVVDVNDNTTTRNATVTINDNLTPTVIVRDTTLQLTSAGTVSLTAPQLITASSDNCGISTSVINRTSFNCSDIGTHTVITTVTDVNGNLSTASSQVTIEDNVAPQVITQEVNLHLDASGQASITVDDVDNGSNDACGIASRSIDINSFDCTDLTSGPGTFDGVTSLTFDGTDDYVESGTMIPYSADHTITAWIKSTVFSRNLFGWGGAGINNYCTVSFLGGSPRYYSGDGAPPVQSVTATTNVIDGTWHHIAISRDASGNVSIYIDGTLNINGSVSKTVNSPTRSIIGAAFANGAVQGHFGGEIDQFTIWSKVLSVADIQALTCTKPGSDPNLVANYTFEDGTGSAVLSDLSGNSYSGTLTNMDVSAAWVSFGSPVTTPYCNAGTSVILTVTDNNGNVATSVANVTIEDNTDPVTISKTKLNVYLDATGNASITPSDVDSGSTDNCSIVNRSLDVTTFDCSDVNATATATSFTFNGGMLPAGWSASPYTVSATTCPGQNSPDNSPYFWATSLSGGVRFVQTSQVDVSLGGNIDFYIRYGNDEGSGCEQPDASNEEVYLQYSINGGSTWIDIYGEWNTTNSGSYAWYNWYWNSIAIPAGAQTATTLFRWYQPGNSGTNYDNWGLEDISVNAVRLLGTTLTTIDQSGNTSTSITEIDVNDTISPYVLTKNITIQLDGSGNASIVPSNIENGSTDACGIDSYTLDISSFTCADVGPNTVTLTVLDINGNSSSETAIVTVEDNVFPIPLVQPVTIYLDNAGKASTTASAVNNGSSDACGIATMTLSKTDFTCADVGSNTVVFTVTDVNSNVSTTNANVTVVDNIAPTASGQSIDLYLDVNGQATITTGDIDNGSYDNCGIASQVLNQTSFDCSHVGANIVTLTVTDVNSNVATVNAGVTVYDTIDPVAITKRDTVYLNAFGFANNTPDDIDGGSTDACGIVTKISSKTFYNCADVGVVAATFTVIDANGNQDSAVDSVVVIDPVPPVVATENKVVYLDTLGQGSIVVEDIDDNSYDENCAVDTMWLDIYDFDCNDIGLNPVTLYVQDIGGNIWSGVGYAIVLDYINPIVITQDQTIYLDANGEASITPQQINNGSWDNCGIWNVPNTAYQLDKTDFTCADLGTNTVTLTVQDNSSNTSSGFASVTVIDAIPPSMVAQNLTIHLDGFGQGSITSSMVDNGSFDNCAIDQMWLSRTDFSCVDAGQNFTITLYGEDASGNVGTTAFNVVVDDVTAPTVVAKPATVVLDASGSGSITPQDVDGGTFDNCTVDRMEVSPNAFDCADVGQATVTLKAWDEHNNLSSATAVVTIQDMMSPVVITQDVVVQLDALGQATITEAMIDNGSFDNCGIASMNLDITAFTCQTIGAQVVTLTVLDVNGNQAQGTATVTVEDNIEPIVMTKNVTVQLNALGQASITEAMIDNGSSDNCGIANVAIDFTDFDCTDVGTNTVVLTVQDVNGNTAQGTATVTVEDNWLPTAVTQDATVQLDANGQAYITVAMIDNGSTDNCSIASRVLDRTTFDCTHVGAQVVTLTVTDVNGNVDQDFATVTVQDIMLPVVLTQDVMIQLDAQGQASITTAMIDNGSYDNCGVASIGLDMTDFDCQSIGTHTVTLNVLDVNGNQAQGMATVTVEDTQAPSVSATGLTIYLDANGDASISMQDVQSSSSDNCGVVGESLSQMVFDCSDVGANLVTYEAWDASGNIGQVNIIITVIDNIAPTPIVQNVTVPLNVNGLATVTPFMIDNGSYDNCGVAQLQVHPTTFVCSQIGTYTVTFTVTDANGNISTTTALVTVEDQIAPTITCPPNKLVNSPANQCGGVVTFALPTTTDNCYSNVRQIAGIPSGSTFPVGVTTNVYEAYDGSGNTASCSFTVTVKDITPPQITCRPDLVIDVQPGTCAATVTFGKAQATDNCTGVFTDQVSGPTSGSILSIGNYTVVQRATDGSGNTNTCSFKIIVRDRTKPVLTCPTDIIAVADPGVCETMVTWNMPTAIDNCGLPVTVTQTGGPVSGTMIVVGSHTATYQAIDQYGNVATCSQMITVEDLEAPIVDVMPDIAVQAATDSCGATVNWNLPTATDNCGLASLQGDHQPGSFFPVGATLVTYTAIDIHGNAGQASFTITVEDITPPALACVSDIAMTADAGRCGAIVTWYAPMASDSCGVASITSDYANGSLFPVGVTTVTITAEDVNGNMTDCDFTVTITDNESPILSPIADIIVPADQGACDAVVTWSTPTATDNCGIQSITTSAQSGGSFPVGNTVVTVEAVDIHGNMAQTAFTVTVEDKEVPIISTVADIATCDDNVSWTIPTATDNCGVQSLTTTHQPGDLFVVGSTPVTYTAVDVHGNTAHRTFNVTVWPKPMADAGVDKAICDGGSTQIGVKPIGGQTYSWLPTTGLTASFVANPGVAPTQTTVYTVKATNGYGCTSTDEVEVAIRPLPTVDAGVDKQACLGDVVSLGSAPTAQGAGGFSYQWSPSTGLSNAKSANPTIQTTATTTYEVKVTDQFGCKQSDMVTITVNALPIATISGPTIICANDAPVQYTAATAGGTWTGTGISASGQFDPVVAGLGEHTITYDVTNTNNCSASATFRVEVLAAPQVIINNPGDLCLSNTPVYLAITPAYQQMNWTGNGIIDPIAGRFDPQSAGAGQHTVTVEVTNAAGCTEIFTDVITVLPGPDASFTAPSQVCNNDGVVTLQAATNKGFWFGRSVDPFKGTFNPENLSQGNYDITYLAFDNQGCTNSVTQTITVDEAPVLDAAITKALCATTSDGEISLNVTGGTGSYAYQWSNGNSTSIISGLVPSDYAVTVTDNGNGCASELALNLSVEHDMDLSTIIVGVSNSLQNGSITLVPHGSGGNGATYQWSTGATTSSIVNLTPGNYSVTITNQYGCEYTFSFLVPIVTEVDEPEEVEEHVAIYPNPTTNVVNVEWDRGITDREEVTIEVFNLLGQKMYHQTLGNAQLINHRISTWGWANGTYLLRLRTNSRTLDHKVIKMQ